MIQIGSIIKNADSPTNERMYRIEKKAYITKELQSFFEIDDPMYLF